MTAWLRRGWSDSLLQTEELRPWAGHAILLDWTLEADAVDAVVPRPVMDAVSTVLVRMGAVAFRWGGEPSWRPDQAEVMAAPRRGVARRMFERVTHRWASDIVLTRHASVVKFMFEHDWELQGQAALIVSGDAEFDGRLRSELATRRQWNDFQFAPSTLALLAPIVDGDGIMFAAASDVVLDTLVAGLRQALTEAGLVVVGGSAS